MSPMTYTPIVATLGYVMSVDRRQVLMIRRDQRKDDAHYGKYNGLGGKIHRDEDVVAGLHREIFEEAAITCLETRFAGTVSWPGFGPNGEDWLGFIFRVDAFSGTPRNQNDEGTLLWVNIDDLKTLPMWEGDERFLPLVFAEPLRQFHGILPYDGGSPSGWKVSFCE